MAAKGNYHALICVPRGHGTLDIVHDDWYKYTDSVVDIIDNIAPGRTLFINGVCIQMGFCSPDEIEQIRQKNFVPGAIPGKPKTVHV